MPTADLSAFAGYSAIPLNLLKLIIGPNTHQAKPGMSLGWATRADHWGNPLALPDSSLREASRCPIEPDPSPFATLRASALAEFTLSEAKDDSGRSLSLMPIPDAPAAPGRASRSPCPRASAMRTAERAWRQALCSAAPGRHLGQGLVAQSLIGPQLAAH